ncbi:MAG: hypothetical protein F6J98_02410 [Moorea sp. SIO4G2]|nr:hypothetical protein [Moorena sp. SIO4G2]
MSESNPNIITAKLPRSYRRGGEQQEISKALTGGIAQYLERWQRELENFESNYLDPRTCYESRLDEIAVELGWGDLWSPLWPVEVKRRLLVKTPWLWSNRGTKESFVWLLESFDLDVDYERTDGWTIGVDDLPVDLSSDPFSYELRFNLEKYPENSHEYHLIEFLARNFIPCWVKLEIRHRDIAEE